MQNILYENHGIQNYLVSPLFTDRTRKVLLALRTRMVRHIKTNFSSLYKQQACQLKCGKAYKDSQEHLMGCDILKTVKKQDCWDLTRPGNLVGARPYRY